MINKYNIGDVLVCGKQTFFVTEIISDYNRYRNSSIFAIIPHTIKYELVSREDDIILSEQTIDDLFTKKEQN
jgi:hypothetical protein